MPGCDATREDEPVRPALDHVSVDLGAFLRSRRARVSPTSAGLLHAGLRRVPGLRREEVTVLAGVSSDYYTKLEQGREHRPSTQVLESLARTLVLGEEERLHPHRLADLVPKPRGGACPAVVAPDLLRLMDTWSDNPAMVLSSTLDVLARNRLARAMYSGLTLDDNLLRTTFLDPEGRRFYQEWDRAAEASVANLRAASGDVRDAPRVRALVDELTRGSPAFERLWERHDVRGKSHEPKSRSHAEVGSFTLGHQAFDVRSAPDQQLVVHQAEPGSRDAAALALLGSITATQQAP